MIKAYMDKAAATPVRREVLEAMLPYFREEFGNPAAVYDLGFRAREAVERARDQVAALIGAQASDIVFTSSGAEANNLAVKGVPLARRGKGNHVIISSIEHHSVLNAARFLERLDYEVTFLPVDDKGLVDAERLRKALRPETTLVSVIHASNEIGTIEPIRHLAAICAERGVVFHTDAVATVGNIPVDVEDLGVDLLSLSGIPLGAPKGTGALYFRKGLRLMPLIHGGIQERGRRAGTENVPGIVGLGKAAELAARELPDRMVRVRPLRDRLVQGVLEKVPDVMYTGHPEMRLPGHASFCFEGIEGEALVFMLAAEGIYVNTGSACASKALKTSPVLVAIGLRSDLAQGSVVLTMDDSNTLEEVDYVLDKLPEAVSRLRDLSPLWKQKTGSQAQSR